ncbi:TetR/AcrR family transcriptional regulator [Nocardia abscessus]|uniref:TetR/AcrR family transcriptional regulator n=1 Tax=Nocardia abscessus TaxID=120957 RepID=A0ABS0C996_9NOCA|nr:TetR/AcrR family transcriptional regulator [Nocardia abscessus]MBF6224983.1 TetR/AcrR family transcriptional regulator [Nocardia abscessus]
MTRSTSAARPAASPARRRIRGLDAEQRSAQRRSQLLDAATELFAEQGFAGTSIEQICQRAYVGTKGFYDHFESKEACYLALLEQVTAQIQQRVADSAASTSAAAWPERVAAIVGAFVHAITDDPRLGRVTFGAAGGISPEVERQRRANRRWAAAFLDRQWSPGDRPQLALATIGGIFELVADWLHTDPAPSPGTLIDDLTHFVTVVESGRRPGEPRTDG